jgi:hypothetical protein
MLDATHGDVPSERGGAVRKGRFVAIALGGMLAASVLGAGIAGGQLPMNISLSGQKFAGTIAPVEGESITVFPRQVDTKTGRLPSVAVLIESARMTDVCLSTVARGSSETRRRYDAKTQAYEKLHGPLCTRLFRTDPDEPPVVRVVVGRHQSGIESGRKLRVRRSRSWMLG